MSSDSDSKLTRWDYSLSFEKLASSDENVMYVAGEASNPHEDEDNEFMNMKSLKKVFSKYMKNPVIKFMHDKTPQWKGAIGVVVEKYTDTEGKIWETSFGDTPFLVAKFTKGTMPEWLWNGIKEGIYKGFSIGGKAMRKSGGELIVKSWLETSVVDVPSAKGSFYQVLKAACISGDCPYEKEEDLKKNLETKPSSFQEVASFMDSVDSFLKVAIPLPPQEEGYEYKPTAQDLRRTAWYNLESLKTFLGDFPKATISDISERFGWADDYITGLRTKLDSVTIGEIMSEGILRFTEASDEFLKGGPGSGQKGHKTAKKKLTSAQKIMTEIMSGDNLDNAREQDVEDLMSAYRIDEKTATELSGYIQRASSKPEKKSKTLTEVLNNPEGKKIVNDIEDILSSLKGKKDPDMVKVLHSQVDKLKDKFGFSYKLDSNLSKVSSFLDSADSFTKLHSSSD